MALLKLKDLDSNYKETFGGYDIKGLDVYSNVNNEKIGSVHDVLVDEQGHFRYLIVDLGFWGFGKQILLPIGRAKIDNDGKQIHAIGFTKEQAEHLPEFNESIKIDRDYEERVKGVYCPRPVEALERPLETDRPLEASREVVYLTPRTTAAQQPPVQLIQQPFVQSTSPDPTQPGVSYQQNQVPPTPPMPTPPVHQVPPVQQTPPVYQGPSMAPSMQHAPPVPVLSVQQATPVQDPLSQTALVPTAQGYPSPVQQVAAVGQQGYVQQGHYDPNAAYYQQDPSLYGMNQQSHSVLQRYEERLLAKKRQERQQR